MDLYDFPPLYDALRSPDPSTLDLIREILEAELPGGVRSIMDPACGPGNWLLPFLDRGVRLAGNDLSEAMVGYARQRLEPYGMEVVHGDMRALRFESGPFDVGMEVSGSACMLPEPGDFAKFLNSLETHVRPGGLVLLTIFFRDGFEDAPRPRLLSEWGPIPVANGGSAWIRYESAAWDEERARERIRRTVRAEGVPGCPAELIDEFDLRIWTPESFRAALAETRHLELVRWHSLEDGPVALSDGLRGEQLAVLRRLPARVSAPAPVAAPASVTA
ncbi:MAG: class I SAM-dependent methyltransferase [Planctomycetota bacterium]|nr:class I SAM-dependent methyltransferase [Planctomycetota bacterium]